MPDPTGNVYNCHQLILTGDVKKLTNSTPEYRRRWRRFPLSAIVIQTITFGFGHRRAGGRRDEG